MTLIETLVALAVLGIVTAGLLGFLYRSPLSQKAYTEDYGRRLSHRALLEVWMDGILGDTLKEHTDSLGVPWSVRLDTASNDSGGVCASAVAVRMGKDSTRALRYCFYE
jgi:hypothetical protein